MKKFALITGCAKGIGKEVALELARDGYNIIATYNTSCEEIKKLKTKIESIGVKFDYYKLNLLNELEIYEFCNIIKEKYSSIDVLINNAALSCDNEFINKTRKEFLNVLEVNLVAPFLLIQGLHTIIEDAIINIASTDGIDTYSKLNMDYSSSKAGLINLTKSLALELAEIRLYALCPNWVNTESIKEMNLEYLTDELRRVKQTRLIEPLEVAHKVIELIYSDIKSGSVIVMEGKYDK